MMDFLEGFSDLPSTNLDDHRSVDVDHTDFGFLDVGTGFGGSGSIGGSDAPDAEYDESVMSLRDAAVDEYVDILTLFPSKVGNTHSLKHEIPQIQEVQHQPTRLGRYRRVDAQATVAPATDDAPQQKRCRYMPGKAPRQEHAHLQALPPVQAVQAGPRLPTPALAERIQPPSDTREAAGSKRRCHVWKRFKFVQELPGESAAVYNMALAKGERRRRRKTTRPFGDRRSNEMTPAEAIQYDTFAEKVRAFRERLRQNPECAINKDNHSRVALMMRTKPNIRLHATARITWNPKSRRANLTGEVTDWNDPPPFERWANPQYVMMMVCLICIRALPYTGVRTLAMDLFGNINQNTGKRYSSQTCNPAYKTIFLGNPGMMMGGVGFSDYMLKSKELRDNLLLHGIVMPEYRLCKNYRLDLRAFDAIERHTQHQPDIGAPEALVVAMILLAECQIVIPDAFELCPALQRIKAMFDYHAPAYPLQYEDQMRSLKCIVASLKYRRKTIDMPLPGDVDDELLHFFV